MPMCNNTNQKIAEALRQMMSKRSFDKITVKNLMDATNMQRQSFYYHFQDTRDVLMWICREELFRPLSESTLEFSDWVLHALTLLNNDRLFFRRVICAAQTDFIRELSDIAVHTRVTALLYNHTSYQKLDDNQRFMVDFATNVVTDYFLRFTNSYKTLDISDARQKIQYLLSELNVGRA